MNKRTTPATGPTITPIEGPESFTGVASTELAVALADVEVLEADALAVNELLETVKTI